MWEYTPYCSHNGIKGQKWGLRKYQYEDGSLTPAGRKHYGVGPERAEETDAALRANHEKSKRAIDAEEEANKEKAFDTHRNQKIQDKNDKVILKTAKENTKNDAKKEAQEAKKEAQEAKKEAKAEKEAEANKIKTDKENYRAELKDISKNMYSYDAKTANQLATDLQARTNLRKNLAVEQQAMMTKQEKTKAALKQFAKETVTSFAKEKGKELAKAYMNKAFNQAMNSIKEQSATGTAKAKNSGNLADALNTLKQRDPATYEAIMKKQKGK